MGRNNVCHEFLFFYLGHSMKSRRIQSIKGFFSRRNQYEIEQVSSAVTKRHDGI